MRVVCLALFCLIGASQAFRDFDLDDTWLTYKATFGKQYQPAEEVVRRKIFEDTVKIVNEHNLKFDLGVHTHRLGLNEFADWTPNEKGQLYGVLPSNSTLGIFGAQHLNKLRLPDSVDWRTKGYVTDVKYLGGCVAYWAFAATGAMEGAHFKKTGKLVSLSEQNLIDCVKDNIGCGGGWPVTAFQYVINNKGVNTEESYPYIAKYGPCRFSQNSIGTTLKSFTRVPRTEAALAHAVATVGPISVDIDANHASYTYYRGGIYKEPKCAQNSPDRSVLVVGYGTENGQDYWILKNSWGASWGEKGYMRMARNDNNLCGIANGAVYPTA